MQLHGLGLHNAVRQPYNVVVVLPCSIVAGTFLMTSAHGKTCQMSAGDLLQLRRVVQSIANDEDGTLSLQQPARESLQLLAALACH